MEGYTVVLFLHICALLGAISTAGILHFAESRLRASEGVGEIRIWAGVVEKGGRVFPLALLLLVGTGAYLVDHGWTWSAGWIVAGLVGVGILFVVGASVIGGRSRALAHELRSADDGATSPPLAHLARDHVGGIASWSNTGLALGIVFVMTTKPGFAGSFASLAVAAGIGIVVGVLLRRMGGHG